MTASLFLLTSRVLPVLQAALQADRLQLAELVRKDPRTVKSLTPITDLFTGHQARLLDVAQTGIQGLQQAVMILAKNGAFAQEVQNIMDSVTSVGTASSNK